MGKGARSRKKQSRDAAKLARRTANYLRCGPKTNQKTTRSKKKCIFRITKSKGAVHIDQPGAKTKARRRKTHTKQSLLGSTNFPLSPLRKRLTTIQMKTRKERMLRRSTKRIEK